MITKRDGLKKLLAQFGAADPSNETVLDQMEERTSKCICCQKIAQGIGIFIPNDPQKFGGKKDVARVIFYGACEPCLALDPKREKIEELILKQVPHE